MAAILIDGKAVAARVRAEVQARVQALAAQGVVPRLDVVLVGDDPASQVYVRNKERAAAEVGIRGEIHRLPAGTPEADVLALLARLNADPEVDGVLVQTPYPRHIDPDRVAAAQDPARDVDGFHPVNLGRLLAGRPGLVACTPAGVMRLIDETGVDLKGLHAVVVGRSVTVGKPAALLLLERHATVTICHSRTTDLAAEVARADVVVAAVGRAGAVKGAWIKPGAIVIDVGINRTPDGKLVGDVEFEAAAARASFITPVPGGVGPMTVAYLLRNTVDAACARRGISG
jgi:methylenetetrahydrofolate dehydrogenase (NADP+)/methenyltetrahydrofolate cyclohydrolase